LATADGGKLVVASRSYLFVNVYGGGGGDDDDDDDDREREREQKRERERAKASERPAEWGRVCNCNELLKLAARTGLLAQVAIRG